MEAPVYHLENVVHVRSELENFDGPLDLILTLLSRNRMEIQDIQISLILDQYLQWMEEQ
jgi:segregation and condensation protein A